MFEQFLKPENIKGVISGKYDLVKIVEAVKRKDELLDELKNGEVTSFFMEDTQFLCLVNNEEKTGERFVIILKYEEIYKLFLELSNTNKINPLEMQEWFFYYATKTKEVQICEKQDVIVALIKKANQLNCQELNEVVEAIVIINREIDFLRNLIM